MHQVRTLWLRDSLVIPVTSAPAIAPRPRLNTTTTAPFPPWFSTSLRDHTSTQPHFLRHQLSFLSTKSVYTSIVTLHETPPLPRARFLISPPRPSPRLVSGDRSPTAPPGPQPRTLTTAPHHKLHPLSLIVPITINITSGFDNQHPRYQQNTPPLLNRATLGSIVASCTQRPSARPRPSLPRRPCPRLLGPSLLQA